MFVEHKEAMEVTEAPVKYPKLSAAIRVGAKLRPQGFGIAFGDGKSCALGAAYEAHFGEQYTGGKFFPFTLMGQTFGIDGSIIDAIWNKNDKHRWTREHIADWLESQGL